MTIMAERLQGGEVRFEFFGNVVSLIGNKVNSRCK